jgi:nucleoside recognition membrane protein YjiH
MPEGMCTNSSTIGFNLVYSTTSDALRAAVVIPSVIGIVTVLSVLAQWFL